MSSNPQKNDNPFGIPEDPARDADEIPPEFRRDPKPVEPAAEKPKVVPAAAPKLKEEATPAATEDELDDDEREFRDMRRDVDGVKGSSGAGIVAISVGKIPEKNAFFRTNRDFSMVTAILIILSVWKTSSSL
jgi:hypothetical protein